MKKKETATKPTKATPMNAVRSVPIVVDGQNLMASYKEFSTGSRGWNISGRVEIDGQRCMVSGNIVIIGSKPKAKGE